MTDWANKENTAKASPPGSIDCKFKLAQNKTQTMQEDLIRQQEEDQPYMDVESGEEADSDTDDCTVVREEEAKVIDLSETQSEEESKPQTKPAAEQKEDAEMEQIKNTEKLLGK